ncbi:MAG TPA: hypothetical protein VMK83_11185 [Gaiellaceae bacterium]|nr:hypothetical protein [Gaiellaceae bacterium]
MHRFSISLSEDVGFAVRKRAAQDDRSLADVVRRALVAYLADHRWLVVTDPYGVAWAEKRDDTTVSRVRLDYEYVPELIEARPVHSMELAE